MSMSVYVCLSILCLPRCISINVLLLMVNQILVYTVDKARISEIAVVEKTRPVCWACVQVLCPMLACQ